MTLQNRYSLELEFEGDPFAIQELRRLLHPRVNRRVKTSQICAEGMDHPDGVESNLVAFAEFYQDGYSAGGVVSRTDNGVKVHWTTAWTNMRPLYKEKMAAIAAV